MRNIDLNYETLSYRTTHNITVKVKPQFKTITQTNNISQFVWSYDVAIENLNLFPIQLVSRYWQVYHANGYIEEVHGDGVVGQQPVIEAGETFNYSSQVKLFTSSGMMVGHYIMQDAIGNDIRVEIPAFSLDTALEEMMIN